MQVKKFSIDSISIYHTRNVQCWINGIDIRNDFSHVQILQKF